MGCLNTPPRVTDFTTKAIQMSDSSAHRPPPGRYDLPESQGIVLNYLNLRGIPVPPAARRRWRRQAQRRERISQAEWIATHEASSPIAQTPDAESVVDKPIVEGLHPRRLAVVERVWELERRPNAPFASSTDWDAESPVSDDLGATATYAALLLDVFSRVKPVDDAQLAGVHRRLVDKALVSVMEITRRLRVLECAGERTDDGIDPLLLPHDPELNVYAGCVVCFAAVADVLLMPCRHLMLCEVGLWVVVRVE